MPRRRFGTGRSPRGDVSVDFAEQFDVGHRLPTMARRRWPIVKRAGIVGILRGLHELVEQAHGEVGLKTIHRRRVDVEFSFKFRADLRPPAGQVFAEIEVVDSHRFNDGAIDFPGL